MVGLRDMSEWRDATEEHEFISFVIHSIAQISFIIGQLSSFISKLPV
jgi:hypothetical protein